jgi:arylsulfatase A
MVVPMRRRTFLSLPGLSAAQRVFAANAAPPNIVIALCDDLGAGDLSCAGHPVIRTPYIDRFAAQGARFPSFYAAAPVCSPSRAGLLTGRTPNRCGIYDWINPGSPVHLRRDETTIATLLRQAGYATCLSGKWHLSGAANLDSQTTPSDHGFQHWFATQNNAAPSHEDPVNFVRNGRPVGPLKGYSSDLIVDEAAQWLARRGPEPFFLFLTYHSPHEPVATAPEFTAMYPNSTRRGQDLYYGNVTQLDRSFGRLLQALDTLPGRDNTLVLFTSDNGPEWLNRYPASWRSHGSAGLLRSQKLSLHEGGIRVPGLLRWPARIRPAQVNPTPLCTTDLLPTLCAAAGIRPPSTKTLDGENVLPALEGRPFERRAPLHWHYCNTIDPARAALRRGDWKLLGFAASDQGRRAGGGFRLEDLPRVKDTTLARFELYNLKDDPREEKDLAAAEPALLRQLSAELNRLDASVRAEAPIWS